MTEEAGVVPEATETPNVAPEVTTDVQPQSFDGNLPSNWVDSLDESYRELDALKGVTNLNELVAKVNTAEKFGMGDNVIKKPTNDEERRQVFRELGMPEKADEYELASPEGLEELGLQFNEDNAKLWKGRMHELGLTNEQAKKLAEWQYGDVMNYQKNVTEQQKQNYAKFEAQMKQEFGDNYDNAIKSATKVAEDFKVKEVLEQAGIYSNPLVQNLLIAVAESQMEDNSFSSSAHSKQLDSISAEIDKLMSSPDYWDPDSEGHRSVKDKVHKLFQEQAMLS